jgi:agmatinase
MILAHLDTWHPAKYPSAWEPTQFNHGSMFWMAGNEGLLVNDTTKPSVHAGLRTRLSGDDFTDHDDDTAQNWVRLSSDDIDEVGTSGIVRSIMDTLGTEAPVCECFSSPTTRFAMTNSLGYIDLSIGIS